MNIALFMLAVRRCRARPVVRTNSALITAPALGCVCPNVAITTRIHRLRPEPIRIVHIFFRRRPRIFHGSAFSRIGRNGSPDPGGRHPRTLRHRNNQPLPKSRMGGQRWIAISRRAIADLSHKFKNRRIGLKKVRGCF